MRRVYVESYGCQMNVADSALVRGVLGEAGLATVDCPGDADVILVNTCAVREHAEERVLGRLTQLLRYKHRDPDVVLGVLGCMARRAEQRILDRAPWVDLIAGPDAYRRLPELLGRARLRDPVIDVRLDHRETYDGVPRRRDRAVRGFVTVQRGCDRFCTFCVVPFVRGRERAVPPDEVLRQVGDLVADGGVEVTLLGQTVSSYRHGETRFSDLLRAVAAVDGVRRIRFTSPHPADFDPVLVATLGEVPEVMPHLHLPVQSGANTVLERMGRGHTAADYERLVADLRATVPGIALTTDLIVGFPGETDAEFEATLGLLARVRFATAFMFRYSEREGTRAARRLPDDVPDAVKAARLETLIAVQERIGGEVFAEQVGRRTEVLLDATSRRDPADLSGRTPDFKTAAVRGATARHSPGDLVSVRIIEASSHSLVGELC